MYKYFDAHCHYSYLKKKYEEYFIAGVSMDYKSSIDTLSLKSNNVLVGVGIHPWRVHEEDLNTVLPLINKADFVGEVGLDYRFAKAPKEQQIRYFEEQIKAGEGKLINVHALDAWEDAFNILIKNDVRAVIFHWYTGPIGLLKDIEGAGYFISINPSVIFQKKHQEVLRNVDLRFVLTESDGGYEYRGKLLEPTEIPNAISFMSSFLSIEEEKLLRIISNNFHSAFRLNAVNS
ncbi:TatD family hydrolase [Saccharolobus solfataricus]|uniref:TatD family hydrolase n=1 Tax=Saccharolobus solfataricus TaxID=2287 RepID=A0A7S9NPZ7_SACSO|nr:TatD family hydrolase [Saccharolobus solfataricus]QPG48596.1 TatD family hydrolase [Saccharolobus solfataricus]